VTGCEAQEYDGRQSTLPFAARGDHSHARTTYRDSRIILGIFFLLNRFSLLTSLRSLDSREFCVDTVPSTCASGGSSRYRHVYSRPRLTPSSRDSLVMFSQAFIRATALRRNFCLYRSFHFLSTSQLVSCKSCKPFPIDFIR
jgi:hypothetical protein